MIIHVEAPVVSKGFVVEHGPKSALIFVGIANFFYCHCCVMFVDGMIFSTACHG